METVLGEYGSLDQRKIQKGKLGLNLAVWRLGDDILELAIGPEDAVELLRRQSRRFSTRLSRQVLDLETRTGKAVEILNPRLTTHKSRAHALERVPPGLDGRCLEVLDDFGFDDVGVDRRIVVDFDKGSAFFKTGKHCLDLDLSLLQCGAFFEDGRGISSSNVGAFEVFHQRGKPLLALEREAHEPLQLEREDMIEEQKGLVGFLQAYMARLVLACFQGRLDLFLGGGRNASRAR
ncbi:hypothetical protein BKA80DRAFT_275174 [Phyllosticta citrichinensis]